MILPRKHRDSHHRRRRRMIHETSAFLTWALSGDVNLPHIPRRAVEKGGFGQFLRLPGARAASRAWWSRTLRRMATDRGRK